MQPPIRVGLIAYGFWGNAVARNLGETLGVEVAAVAEPDLDRLGAAGRRFPMARLWPDAGEMIARDDLDAVAVTTPVSTHHSLGLAALRSGLHVLMAKPLAASVREAAELRSAAAAKRLVLLTDHTFVYSPAVAKLRDLVAAGALGDIWHVASTRTNLGLFRDDCDVVWDLAAHDFAILLDVFGPIREVSCAAADPLRTGRAAAAQITCWLESGALATVEVSWLSPVKVRRFLVCGSRASVLWDDVDASEPLRMYDRGVSLDPEQARVSYRLGDVVAPRLERTEALAVECAHFAACVRGEAEPLTGPAIGAAVVHALAAASASLADGGRVPVKPLYNSRPLW